MGDVQPALGSQSLIRNDSAGDAFLNCIFTLFTRKAAEMDFGAGLDGRLNFQKTFLPITRCLWNCTHRGRSAALISTPCGTRSFQTLPLVEFIQRRRSAWPAIRRSR
ncbi:MAG: hypothetical protein ABSB74_14445 [Tepidisphaeraceae bacterium]